MTTSVMAGSLPMQNAPSHGSPWQYSQMEKVLRRPKAVALAPSKWPGQSILSATPFSTGFHAGKHFLSHNHGEDGRTEYREA
jgi:hypothetical protein